MNQPAVPLSPSPHGWHWPVDIARYDRSPHLTEVERAELERAMKRKPFQLRPPTKLLLHRLLQPLQDVFTATHLSPIIRHDTMRIMLIEMHRRGKTFWAWSEVGRSG